MKRILWYIYFSFIFISSVLTIIDDFNPIRVPITLLCLLGLFCFIRQKPLGSRRFWRAIFWLQVAGLSAGSAVALFYMSQELLIQAGTLVLFAAPLVYALHKYSSINNDIWAKYDLEKKLELANGLFSKSNQAASTLTTEIEGTERRSQVLISKNEDRYTIEYSIESGDSKSKSSFEVMDLKGLVSIVEQETGHKICDFQYRT